MLKLYLFNGKSLYKGITCCFIVLSLMFSTFCSAEEVTSNNEESLLEPIIIQVKILTPVGASLGKKKIPKPGAWLYHDKNGRNVKEYLLADDSKYEVYIENQSVDEYCYITNGTMYGYVHRNTFNDYSYYDEPQMIAVDNTVLYRDKEGSDVKEYLPADNSQYRIFAYAENETLLFVEKLDGSMQGYVKKSAMTAYDPLLSGQNASATLTPEMQTAQQTQQTNKEPAEGKMVIQQPQQANQPLGSEQPLSYVQPLYTTPSFPSGQKYPVYSGPGDQYYRAANGKASVSTNDWIHVIGISGNWVLIEYSRNESAWRRGYISFSYLPQGISTNLLPNADITATIKTACNITDDPAMSKEAITVLQSGTNVTYLFSDGKWAYVEARTDIGLMRGYVNIDNLVFN